MALTEFQSVRTRTFDLVRANSRWTINGTTWDDVVASGFTRALADPVRDDVEIWEIRNPSGGWHHPFHIHFIDFKVLSRNGQPALPHERGAKDVVFVGENESVRLLIRFDSGEGRYMMHCHNLVHEDHDMMAQFEIRNPAVTAHDPMGDPCRPLPSGCCEMTTLTHAADPAAEVEHDLPDVVVPVAMAWSVAAGVIHLLVAPAHLREAWWLGAGFVAVGLAQVPALVALLMRPQPVWVLLVATWGCATAAGFYVATRTVDVWFMPAHGRGHEVGHLPVLNGVGRGSRCIPATRSSVARSTSPACWPRSSWWRCCSRCCPRRCGPARPRRSPPSRRSVRWLRSWPDPLRAASPRRYCDHWTLSATTPVSPSVATWTSIGASPSTRTTRRASATCGATPCWPPPWSLPTPRHRCSWSAGRVRRPASRCPSAPGSSSSPV